MSGILSCKLTCQAAFKAGGDVFHKLFLTKPHHLANIAPTKIQACKLHQGDHGTIGATLEWKYAVDGKEQIIKEVIQNIDEEKKLISYKAIDGDLLQLYKNVVITFHVETKGGIDFIMWTIDYELLNPNNPHPLSLLNFLIELVKDYETHIFG